MNTERITELIARKMGKAATEEELTELEQWLEAHPEQKQFVELLESLHLRATAESGPLPRAEAGWEKLQAHIQAGEPELVSAAPVVPLSRTWRLGKVALWMGAAATAGALSYFAFKPLNRQPAQASLTRKLEVPFGKPERTQLPDGSEVWVNSGSRIQYSYDEAGATRHVFLEGEAYFKVKHDPEHPFIVHARNIAVRALGTEFNVTAYPDETQVETTLVSGKVQVTMTDKPDQRIILAPKEKLTVSHTPEADSLENRSTGFQLQTVDVKPSAAPELAWMHDKLSFQNESFVELARKMERRYKVHIVFHDSQVKEERLSGLFENESIHKALQILQMTTAFKYKVRADSVFIGRP